MKKRKIITLAISALLLIFGIYLLLNANNDSSRPAFSKSFKGNYEDIFNKMLIAAEKGDSTAQVNIANMYKRGLGVRQDYQKAIYWYQKAIDQKNTSAFIGLALMYQKAEGVDNDIDKATTLYKEAISIDNSALAKNNLSSIYLKKGKIEKGLRLLKEAAEQNDPTAQYILGSYYYFGKYGLQIDYQKAIDLIKLGAEQGLPNAQNNLALAYYEGKAISKNDYEAYKWFCIAGNYGNLKSSKQALKNLKFDISPNLKQKATNEARSWIEKNNEINLSIVGVK